MRYYKPEENEWIYPRLEGYKLACCDCGLVHLIDFEVSPEFGVRMKFREANRNTGQKRRHNKNYFCKPWTSRKEWLEKEPLE